MAVLVIAGGVVVAGYWMLLQQSRRGTGSAPFLLSAFPIALLLLIAPVPAAAVQTIATFNAIGTAGSSHPQVSALAIGIVRPLWFGSLGFLVALCAAGVIQVLGMDDPEQVPEPVDAPAGVGARNPAWPAWILGASPLLIIPTALLIQLTAGVASLIVTAIAATSSAASERLFNGMDLTRFTQMLSARLIGGALGGTAMLLFVLVFAIAAIVAHRFSTKSDALARFSRGVTILVGIYSLWNFAVLTLTLRSFTP